MRLNSIKLSGFKSFAEPTHFQLPGQLVGVVGPNGCGKSNIMDAVRWVLGESKASELRGESMQDVIFNGSGQRKPAGRASVELVFSNEDARAGGQWNRFAEIAVKRVLTRDGTSSYYINNQPVRRRDVQEVFLGTGLGPRAYAIIGQGTISRIIESRPEELRLFLEEAAGVSKYKERRRETEQRLRDTRENLTRVDDIVRELDAQLEKLEAQAALARRFSELQAQSTLRQQQLWAIRQRDAEAEAVRLQAAAAAADHAVEARTADLRHAEAALDALRQDHYAASDALHAAQGGLAEAALAVSRLEERIRYAAQARHRAGERLAGLQQQLAQWTARREAADAELGALAAQRADAEQEVGTLAARLEAQQALLPAVEEAQHQAQAASQRQRGEASRLRQQIELLAAESRSVVEQLKRLAGRDERLADEQRRLDVPDPQRLVELQARVEAAAATSHAADGRLHQLTEQLPRLDEERRQLQARQAAEAAQGTRLAARSQALQALQEKVQTDGRLRPWLARHGLASLPALWKRIEVEAGWEPALEAALRERLGAIEVDRLDAARGWSAEPPPVKLTLFAAMVRPAPAAAAAPAGLKPLAEWLRIGAEPDRAGLRALLNDWLAGVFAAVDLDQALAARDALAPGQLIVTPAGHAVGRSSLHFHAADSEQAGLLARAHEITDLERELRAQALIADEARACAQRAEAAYADAAQQLAAARRDAAEAQKGAHALQVDWLRLGQQAEQSRSRSAQLEADRHEVATQQAELEGQRHAAEARLERLQVERDAAQHAQGRIDATLQQAQRDLTQASEQQRALERRLDEARFSARALVARQAELQRAAATAAEQIERQGGACSEVEAEIEHLADASAEEELQSALALRLEREQQLGATRHGYDELSLALRRADEARLRHEQSLQPLRETLGRLQLEQQAAELRAAQHREQLQAAGADFATVLAGLALGEPRPAALQAEIDRAQRELAELGAVNLAALEELGTARERKGFLDAQLVDLRDAIATLEDAIRKIDLETRELLSSTFEQVNGHFGRMFPSLFGGGTARLVMTGEEILDAGVQVMAQPPGKKNSTIHLLSGGEKALTAIALVFAIFQLNPAPFCLLDEVDAPLDDANTERYARLVGQMSQSTQFLFISHNKIAMEMAQQLIGVTMQEQGVSRIVAVDIEAAAGLAVAA